MKRLLTTTAIVAMTAMPVAAEQHTQSAGSEMAVSVGSEEVRVSNMMDAKVYMPQEGSSKDLSSMEISEVPDNWTEIGSINDVFVDTSGKVSTVVLSPGDAIKAQAEKVGLKVDSLSIKKAQNGDKIFVVYTGDKVTLEQSKEFDEEQAKKDGQQSVSEQSKMAQADQGDSGDMKKEDGQENDQAKADGQKSDQAMADAQKAETKSNGLTIRAADLTGHAVYIPGEGSTGDEIPTELTDVEDTWERVGEISSVILSRDGQIKSVTLDAGGFLGMGEKEVETGMDELKFVADSDSDADNEWFVVYTGDRSALQEKEEYDEQASQDRGEQRMTQEDMAKANQQRDADQAKQSEQDQAKAEGDQMKKDGESSDKAAAKDNGDMNASGAAGAAMLSAEELDGAPVYDSNGEEIGNVSRLLMDDNGEISEVIIDVGGFLGLGEKPVAIKYDDLQIDENVDTAFGDVRVSVSHTRDELDQMERWTE